jgi:hypothetical protein
MANLFYKLIIKVEVVLMTRVASVLGGPEPPG